MEDITSGTKINWSTALYNVLVNMIVNHATGFTVQINKMFPILGVPVSTSQDCTKTKMLDAVNILALHPKISVLHVAAIKKELGESQSSAIEVKSKRKLNLQVILNRPRLKGLMLNPFFPSQEETKISQG